MQISSEFGRGSNQERENREVNDLADAGRVVVDAVAEEEQVRNRAESSPGEFQKMPLSHGDVVHADPLLQLEMLKQTFI